MIRSMVVGLVVVLLVTKAMTGLSFLLPRETEKDTLTFPAGPAKSYEVRTENGTIAFEGRDDPSKAEIVATREARASSRERAKEALDAIEVTIEGKETQRCRIGWRWRRPKQHDWSAVVDFKIRAPKGVDLKIDGENGRVLVENLAGNATIRSENGRIDAQTTGSSLDVKTENGEVRAKFAGQKLKLKTQNGRISADLSECGKIEGEIATVNGYLQVAVGEHTSCELAASTQNGHIKCQPTLEHQSSPRREPKRQRSVSGMLGSGGGKLSLTCVNGAIRIDGQER